MLLYLNMEGEAERFLKCYNMLMDQDIEKMTKSNFGICEDIVEGFRCEANIKKLKKKIPDFEKIKV